MNFLFMQNKEGDNKRVAKQRAQEILKPSCIYLDSMSSFYQMFCTTYMTDVRQGGLVLHRKYNGNEPHSNEKRYGLDMCCMWLVCSGITNFLSLPSLE